jgi:hypothetical protein
MKDLEKNNMDLEKLEEVVGGTRSEELELIEFVKTHTWCTTESDVWYWLKKESGLQFRSLHTSTRGLNEFELMDGTKLNHRELMTLLRERISDDL